MNSIRGLGLVTLVPSLCLAQITGTAPSLKLDAQPWGMDHSNPARTGSTSFQGPAIGVVEWSRKVGGGARGIASDRSGHAILGATFYTEWWSNELYVQSYDKLGDIAWRQKVTPYNWGGSQGVKSAPALAKNGDAWMNSGAGQLIKFNAAGDQTVTVQVNASSTNDSAPALLKDGSVVHYQNTALAKYSTVGLLVWSTVCFSQTDPAVAPNGDVAIGGVRTNEPHGAPDVYYFNSNGTLRWSRSSTYGTRTQVCFGPDGTLYTTVFGVTAYNPDGTVKWNVATGGWGVCLDHLGRALVPQGNKVYAYNKDTGVALWTATLPGAGGIVEGLSIDGGNNIYLSTSDGYVMRLDKNGVLSWSLKVCDQIYTQPCIAGGALYVAGRTGYDDNFLYRIK